MSKVKEVKKMYEANEHILSYENHNFEVYIYSNKVVGYDKNEGTYEVRNGGRYSKASLDIFFRDLGRYEIIESNLQSDRVTLNAEIKNEFMEVYLK
jgi:hypothetical protein